MSEKHQVGLRLADLRRKAGLTQEALAERAGLSGQSISQIECGTQDPKLKTIFALAEALKVGPALFFPTTPSGRRVTPRDKRISEINAILTQMALSELDFVLDYANLVQDRKKRLPRRRRRASR